MCFLVVKYLCVSYLVQNILGSTKALRTQETEFTSIEASNFLRTYDIEASKMCHEVTSAQWNYATNMTDINKRKMIDEQTLKAKFDKISWERAAIFEKTLSRNSTIRRQLKFLMVQGRASLRDEKYDEIHHLISEMKDTYNQVRICPLNTYDTKHCNLTLDPDVKQIMAHSRDPFELANIWRKFHDQVGLPLKNKFMRYVQLANQASITNGFKHADEQMWYTYEEDNFQYEITATWKKLQPLYKELFSYVRKKLYLKYGPDVVRLDGPLPAHLLGDIWAQDWTHIADIVVPYPFENQLNITDMMLQQGYTPLRLFQLANEFFTSLGLKAMSPEFWKHSIFEKPLGRNIQCTASAWDFCNKVDYRIKQCSKVSMDDFLSAHHEMAHIQYYLHYSNQPYLYRDGANPGFHEAIANMVLLSVHNPVHLSKIGLFQNRTDGHEFNINFLMIMALKKIAYAPFALLVDQWLHQIFKDGVQDMNVRWWQLRLHYQGMIPPVPRTNQHLDAVSKRHILADIPYIQYYVALLLEFQMHEALCLSMGHTGELHRCDVYKSREVGRILTDVLTLGRSRHWKDVLKIFTRGGMETLSAEAMLRYFQPLANWLKVQNKAETIGWNVQFEDMNLFHPLKWSSGRPHLYSRSYCNILVIVIHYLFLQ